MAEPPRLPLLVLLPGLDGTGKLFANFLRELHAGVDVQLVAYPTDHPLGYEELENRVRAALPIDRPFVLLGESFSGPIAVRIAAAAPAGLVGLILCGTFARNPYPLLGWASSLAFLVPLKSLPRWIRAPLMWGSASAKSVPKQSERAIAGVSRAVIRRRIAAILTVDAGEALKQVTVPALVMYAQKDRVIPYAATRWMAAQLPHAEIAPIAGPHLLLQSCPAECAAAVMQFLHRAAAVSAHEQDNRSSVSLHS